MDMFSNYISDFEFNDIELILKSCEYMFKIYLNS